VIAFKTMLENKLRGAGNKINSTFYDERFTTVIAERALIEADLSRKKRKSVIDKQAAVVILQSYLDHEAAKRGMGDGA
jgi:putative Holliday junction resolvase